jgi:electron transport complex protein RnfE
MAEKPYGAIVSDGLWSNNQALVALLGLCPLLATTTSATNGLGMGLATTAVLVLSNLTISLIRNLVRPEVRLPVFVLVIASFVTAVELGMQAFFYELYKVLGLFIPLIVTNCAIIGRAEAFASKNKVDRAVVDGLAMGLGFTLVLMTLGGIRELVGQGTLFHQAHLMLGEAAKGLSMSLGADYQGALLAILPPGAFIGLGLLIALKNIVDKRVERRARAARGEQRRAAPSDELMARQRPASVPPDGR